MIIVLAASLQAQWSNDPNNNLIVGYGLDPHICSDSAGGCYITYDYNSTSYPRWLAVERLDKYGYKPWGINKRILGEYPEQSRAEIIEDGEGGVIVSYQDNEWIPPSTSTRRVRVQRVDSSGNFLWGQTGVRVSLSETNQGGQKIISDGDGGCIVVWGDTLAQIRINRINSIGERLWGDSGKVIETNPIGYTIHLSKMSSGHFAFCYSRILFGFNINGEVSYRDSLPYRILNITSDESGGVVASWYGGSSSNIKIHSQRRDSLGNNLWQEPYVEIADSLNINTMLSIIHYNGYYFYGWMGKKNGSNEILQIQGLRYNGSLLFSQGSISISNNPGVTTYIPIIPSDSGSFIFISSYTIGTFGQKIDTLGLLRWNSEQVLLNYPQLGLDHSYATSDCFGGAIGLGDYLTDFAIPVFKVSSKGILGEIMTSVESRSGNISKIESFLFQNFPNPFNSSTIIKYQIPKVETHRDASLQLVKLIVYDVLGNEVATLVNEEKLPGVYEVELNAASLASGIYLYKLQAGHNFVQTKKMILLK